jgi:hypothetical protein
LALCGIAGLVGPAASVFAADSTAPGRNDGAAYTISGVTFDVPSDVGGFPQAADFQSLKIDLVTTPDGGYGVPANLEKDYRETVLGEPDASFQYWPVAAPVELTPADLSKAGVNKFHASAIWAMEREISGDLNTGEGLNGHRFIAISVSVDPNDIAADGTDKRGTRTTLHLIVKAGKVTSVRTVAFGDRVKESDRINSKLHNNIRENSPVGPGANQTAVVRKDEIDDYVYRVDRLPGTKVDVALSSDGTTESDGSPDVVLDYLVTEGKPWYAYVQETNTGTRDTGAWRTKVGYVNNQLTNHNDIFSVDYTFASPESSEEVTGSYEMQLSSDNRLRARVYGSADRFQASDVGFADENFHGNDQTVGIEASYNVFQYHDVFVDAFGGGRYQHFNVKNFANGGGTPSFQEGSADYYIPYGGVRASKTSDPYSVAGDVTVLGGFARADSEQDLENLGRLNPSRDWVMLQADFSESIYLEPIFKALGLPNKPGTLANELAVYGRYQEAFGSRLIPELEQTAGGFYTVRGYSESAVAGDRALIGTVEYRFHLPRYLDASSTPGTLCGQPFRYVPQQAFGKPDWDMIFRTFVDAGRIEQSGREQFERDDTLVSTGVGLELQLKQNIDIRADWGVALKSISDGTEYGSNRFHLSFTLLY